jgi:hypothetical protein
MSIPFGKKGNTSGTVEGYRCTQLGLPLERFLQVCRSAGMQSTPDKCDADAQAMLHDKCMVAGTRLFRYLPYLRHDHGTNLLYSSCCFPEVMAKGTGTVALMWNSLPAVGR